MIRYSFFTILFITLFFTAAQAQRFEPGYIVSNGGDTTRGFVSEKSLIRGYSKVVFKATKDGETVTYGPDAIRGFQGETGKFVSLPSAIPGITGLRFAKELVTGPLRLYRHDRTTFGVISDSVSSLRVLRNKNYIRFYVRNCPSLFAAVAKLKNNEEGYLNFFSELYRCTGSEYKVNLRPEKPAYFVFGAEAGYGMSTLSYNREIPEKAFPYIQFEPSFAPFFLASTTFFPATRTRQNFAFQASLSGTKSVQQGSYFSASGTDSRTEQASLVAYNFSVSVLGIKYLRINSKNFFMVGVGATNQFISLKSGMWERNDFQGNAVTTTMRDLQYLSNSAIGPVGLVGVTTVASDRPISFSIRSSYLFSDRFSQAFFGASVGAGINKILWQGM